MASSMHVSLVHVFALMCLGTIFVLMYLNTEQTNDKKALSVEELQESIIRKTEKELMKKVVAALNSMKNTTVTEAEIPNSNNKIITEPRLEENVLKFSAKPILPTTAATQKTTLKTNPPTLAATRRSSSRPTTPKTTLTTTSPTIAAIATTKTTTTVVIPTSKKIPGKYDLITKTMGRFGNHIFIYAAVFGIAKDTYRNPLYYGDKELLKVFDQLTVPSINISHYEHYKLHYSPLNAKYDSDVINLPAENMIITGHFQSWRYFQKYEKELRKELVIKESLRNQSKEFHQKLKKELPPDVVTVGIHIRRGDFLQWSHFRVADESYMQFAIQHFQKQFQNVQFIVCSTKDGMVWGREVLKNVPHVTFVEGNDYPLDFTILAMCDHMITTVGTFGWWAGWLTGGQVTYYSKPYAQNYTVFDGADYFLPSWIGYP